MKPSTTKELVEAAIGDSLDRANPVVFQTRMHVVGADVLPFKSKDGSTTYTIHTWCDCGWTNQSVKLEDEYTDPGSIPYELIVEAVKPWREHLWLSNRLFYAHRNLAKAEKKAQREKAAAATDGEV